MRSSSVYSSHTKSVVGGQAHSQTTQSVLYPPAEDENLDAYFQHTLSGEPVILNDVDTLVTAFGAGSFNNLEKELKNTFDTDLHVIGDALSPRTVEEAILDGLKASTII